VVEDAIAQAGLRSVPSRADAGGVGGDLLDDSDVRCPGCGAALRPSAPWCTQCFLDLRVPEPAAPAPAVPDPLPAHVAAAPEAAPVAAPPAHPGPPVGAGPLAAPVPAAAVPAAAEPGWACPACGTPGDLAEADECAECGSGLFDVLRAGEPSGLRLPLVGDVAALTRLQLLGAGALLLPLLLAVLLGLTALAGALLT